MADTSNTKNNTALELEAGDILFFKPPKAGGSFTDKAIQQFQKARGVQSWEYVHTAVVVKKTPLTIAHITTQGTSEVLLGNSAYINHTYDVNRCNDSEKRNAIALAAKEAVNSNAKYAITTAIPAFLRGEKSASTKADKNENEAVKNEFMCASFVANILAKSVGKSAVTETNVLPGALRKNLNSGQFSAINRSESESKNIESTDKNKNLYNQIEKFIENAAKASSRGLFQKLSRTVVDENMRNVLANLNQDIFLSNKSANPILNVKDALVEVMENSTLNNQQKKYLMNLVINEASRVKIINKNDFTKNLFRQQFGDFFKLSDQQINKLTDILIRKSPNENTPANEANPQGPRRR